MLIKFKDHRPVIHPDTFIAPGSAIIGRCFIEEQCGIWFNAVLRADVNEIRIGRNTNIQDGSVIHCDHDYPTAIGENVTVGHNAIIHGCTIEDNCIIGMGATVLDGAKIGKNSIVGANSLVTSDKEMPEGSLIMGSPAKVVRALTSEEIQKIRHSADEYASNMKHYL